MPLFCQPLFSHLLGNQLAIGRGAKHLWRAQWLSNSTIRAEKVIKALWTFIWMLRISGKWFISFTFIRSFAPCVGCCLLFVHCMSDASFLPFGHSNICAQFNASAFFCCCSYRTKINIHTFFQMVLVSELICGKFEIKLRIRKKKKSEFIQQMLKFNEKKIGRPNYNSNGHYSEFGEMHLYPPPPARDDSVLAFPHDSSTRIIQFGIHYLLLILYWSYDDEQICAKFWQFIYPIAV